MTFPSSLFTVHEQKLSSKPQCRAVEKTENT